MKIFFDYETRSGLNLPDVGKYRYLRDRQADIVCLAYKINKDPTQIWTPRMPLPTIFKEPTKHTWFAFNSEFDRAVTNILGTRYGMKPLPIENTVDCMSVCGKFSYPQNLDKVGIALNLMVTKDRKGKALMKKICIPPFDYTPEELKAFFRYCIRDVDTLYEAVKNLPSDTLDDKERQVWENTMLINATGMPIDEAAVTRINQVIDFYTARETKKLERISDGAVTTAGQRDRIIQWAKGFDVELPNLQASTVDEAIKELREALKDTLEDPQILQNQEKVLQLLLLRKRLGGAAIKKYKRLQNMVVKGRLYDTIRYCGAGHTGRDSGMGFQLQNLPRASVDDPEEMIQKFYDTTILQMDDPLAIAKALIRPMIRARKGYKIIAADFSSIEYVLLMWFCGEKQKLEDFRNGICPYKTFATQLLGISYADVTKSIRQDSKPGILGGGYCLSGKSLVPYAKDMGVDIGGLERANRVIQVYRAEHPNVVETWSMLLDASIAAVENEGELFPVNLVSFRTVRSRTGDKWLILTLPSGRHIYYCQPVIGESYGRKVVKHMGVNSKTKKWQLHTLRASVLINNVIQGAARDILMEASIDLSKAGYHIIGRVHDEIICEEKVHSMQTLDRMIEIMVSNHYWCSSAPLRAEGFVSERYKK